ncbi:MULTISPECIES: hypothetical protein [Bacillus]|uniref:hypothetical protein n=1 Tax=Bacillus TaxID=1386 RepID=UPI000BECF53A|nr:hypothetical protein [Bacillus pseudomycoides]PEE38194.1 hypothetical protein COO02_22525 [Bacillus pseudomycoides]PEI86146.1 hypothetical protein CN679_23740 [Bacillus pseudomycoides]PGA83878.1 hypothetical protein COL91_26125 [Bacillus pseudomycoides]PHF52306.1 hypothetical protein COF72_00280 [Bacillus pseudomycoides]
MTHFHSDLYEISMPGCQELMWYPVEVKRGKQIFTFEIYRACDTISVFYMDELGRKRAVVGMEELEMMLVIEEDKQRFRNFVGDTKWAILDGMCLERGMTKEEIAAYLYLKQNVLDKMEKELEV